MPAAHPLQGVPQDQLMRGDERDAPKLFRQDGRVDWRKSPKGGRPSGA